MQDDEKRKTFIRLIGAYFMNGLRRFMEDAEVRTDLKNFMEILMMIDALAETLEVHDQEH